MLRALEQIRRMRGGAQSHLMRCDDGYYYVVKFQNNPQHRRVLVNELLGTRLAGRLERQMTERVLDGFLREIPPEWYADDYGALSRLAEQLHGRRTRVPDLILEAKRSSRQPFPNWI